MQGLGHLGSIKVIGKFLIYNCLSTCRGINQHLQMCFNCKKEDHMGILRVSLFSRWDNPQIDINKKNNFYICNHFQKIFHIINWSTLVEYFPPYYLLKLWVVLFYMISWYGVHLLVVLTIDVICVEWFTKLQPSSLNSLNLKKIWGSLNLMAIDWVHNSRF